jgi:IMP and pyridine-specific 5'-nucleotidase
MIELFVTLMKSNIDVGIVTAAGYPGEAAKFENRIQGLLAAFSKYRLPATITNRCVCVYGLFSSAPCDMLC